MPPFTPKSALRWHVLLWLAYVGYVLLGDWLLFEPKPGGSTLTTKLWLQASFLTARMVAFYCCYLLVYPRWLHPGRLPRLALGLLGAVLLFAGTRALLEEALYPAVLGFRNYGAETTAWFYLLDNTYYAVLPLALSAMAWTTETTLRRERETRQLTAEKRAAEAAFLKTQINPHFLYNTLNMLFGRAYAADKELAGALLKLSELMRYMLRDTPDGRVDLQEEIDYLENFLALHRLRFSGRLNAELSVEGDPAGHRVAPLLLIPFVENAFKHGVLDDPAAPVRLHLRLQPGRVEFTATNRRHDYQTDATSGIGLGNLRRRLQLLYAGRHELQAGPDGAEFRAHLLLHDEAARVTPVPAALAAAHPLAPASVSA
ncbi:sensor histidine kinase [Hymenobacter jeollabukensis]|uniref:Histidine kinase n=1 Tax=Hymenobacter jeollabukensis TaxID=2025313 RepID=A0A5R8WWU6_9BACT|nr:sensor histidine kinase [Hymenobacter jeollabukensis]TLM96533.1 histidine kinase [Hymenobacter jeollabukensis]